MHKYFNIKRETIKATKEVFSLVDAFLNALIDRQSVWLTMSLMKRNHKVTLVIAM